jgi:Uncharacterized protein conserved in bacteria (DUF2334)
MPAAAIRLDDVHGRTPIELLERMDTELWRGRPVTLATIPYPAPLSLGPAGTQAETPGGRSTMANLRLVRHLDAAIRRGCEVALHGLTHADHKSPAGPAVPELVATHPGHDRLLCRTLEGWRERFGTSVLVPPHNAIGPELAASCVESGFVISRSITDTEVAALGFQPTDPQGRAKAKLIPPSRRSLGTSEFFQTIGLSHKYVLRSGMTPAATASILARTAAEAGNATVTFHWWDFAAGDGASTAMWHYAAELIYELSPLTHFETISAFARPGYTA